MSQRSFDPCGFAIERYKGIARWRNLWTILLFFFGATVVVFLCICIVLFIKESWLPGAVATVGTIVNGVGIAWVVARRTDAVREEAEAYSDLKSVCGGVAPARATVATEAADEGVPQEVLDFQKKLLLFGRIR